jgi:hypothetical protein
MQATAHHSDLLLIVSFHAAPRRLSYYLAVQSESLGLGVSQRCEKDLMEQPQESYLRELFDEIEGWSRETGGPRSGSEGRLRSIGWHLGLQLLPPDLAVQLRDACERSGDRPPSLCILSDETLFPWELVCLPDREGQPGSFLAEAFDVTR